MDSILCPARLKLGQHLDCKEIVFILMLGIRIRMGMDNADTVNYMSMRKQRNPADVPDQQQRKKTVYETISQFPHQVIGVTALQSIKVMKKYANLIN